MSKNKRKKIGRNELCSCGSEKKYKRCHGSTYNDIAPNFELINKKIEERNMLEIQRKRQQGLGKPIVQTEYQGKRIVAVGNKLYYGAWKTFHDFLFNYIKIVMGSEWRNSELKKPDKERHFLMQVYDNVCQYQKKIIKVPGEIHFAPFTGAVNAYMWLSYNLYLIVHNADLHNRLIDRLQKISQFPGAYYETYVAAIFIRAGFLLEFEDETDRKISHCEFTAIHQETGKKYSVECKFGHRQNLITPHGSGNFNLGIAQPLHQALVKRALFERIVFIDLNLPTSEIIKHKKEDFIHAIKKCENDVMNGQPLPPAYVFLTNHSYHYDLDSTEHTSMYILEGFKIPDIGQRRVNLHEAIKSRKKHFPIHQLWNSIKTHVTIPSTFDGSIPEFSFKQMEERLIVGQKYTVNDQDGNSLLVELCQTVVDEKNKKISTLCKDSEGNVHVIQWLISDLQINAYKRNPDTYFGVYKNPSKEIEIPLEMFDFFIQGFKLLSKNELLTRLIKHPQYSSLQGKEQDELLEIYCESLTNQMYKPDEGEKNN